MCKYGNVQGCKFATMQMCKCVNMQLCKYATMQLCKGVNVQVCKCASMQMCKWANLQECRPLESLNVCQFISVSTRLMAIGLVFPLQI